MVGAAVAGLQQGTRLYAKPPPLNPPARSPLQATTTQHPEALTRRVSVLAVHPDNVRQMREAVFGVPGARLRWVRPLKTSGGDLVEGVMQVGVTSNVMPARDLKAQLAGRARVQMRDLSTVYAACHDPR